MQKWRPDLLWSVLPQICANGLDAIGSFAHSEDQRRDRQADGDSQTGSEGQLSEHSRDIAAMADAIAIREAIHARFHPPVFAEQSANEELDSRTASTDSESRCEEMEANLRARRN